MPRRSGTAERVHVTDPVRPPAPPHRLRLVLAERAAALGALHRCWFNCQRVSPGPQARHRGQHRTTPDPPRLVAERARPISPCSPLRRGGCRSGPQRRPGPCPKCGKQRRSWQSLPGLNAPRRRPEEQPGVPQEAGAPVLQETASRGSRTAAARCWVGNTRRSRSILVQDRNPYLLSLAGVFGALRLPMPGPCRPSPPGGGPAPTNGVTPPREQRIAHERDRTAPRVLRARQSGPAPVRKELEECAGIQLQPR
jgi:hypothetical protein